MPIRPLYLEAGQPLDVGLADGVSLFVVQAGRARSLYPLRRLSRVVSGRNARWSTDALVACMDAGVPVLFRDGRGNPIGWCFGERRRETTLGELLRLGIGDPNWPSNYGAWKDAAQRREIRSALQCMGLGERAVDPKGARSDLCNAHRVRIGVPCRELLSALEAAVAGLVAETLARQIGESPLIGFARPGLHLGMEFTDLLQWRLHRILQATPAGLLRESRPDRFAARAIEQHGGVLHRTLGQLLGDLELSLRNWLL
jgi:hypothetical protein